jgi:predicted nucleotidyltransferase
MDIYKEEFTGLEREILRFLFFNAGKPFNQRRISINLKVSPTAVSNSLKKIQKKGLIEVNKSKDSNVSEVTLKLDHKNLSTMKRVENLRVIYISGLLDFLSKNFPKCTIVLFGSFSRGEDNFLSDIDIAIIGSKERSLDLKAYENLFKKKISLQFYPSFKEIHTNLKESIINGIVLQGGLEL